MNSKTLRITLQIIGSIVAVAWIIECMTRGKGFISTYMAPFAFGPLIIAAFMAMNEKKVNSGQAKMTPISTTVEKHATPQQQNHGVEIPK